jgi:hypothetical protein
LLQAGVCRDFLQQGSTANLGHTCTQATAATDAKLQQMLCESCMLPMLLAG